jgi:iron complex transport system permease protein
VLYKVSPFRKTVTHHLLVFALLSALSLGSVLAAVFLGPAPLSFSQVVAALLGKGEDKARIIVWELRFPRASLGFLAGAALSLSGAVMQGVFRNPLASPYLLGVAAGSTAGAAAAVAFGPSFFPRPVAAFLGGICAAFLVWKLGRTELGLILAGIALSSLFSAATSFLLFLTAGNRRLEEILFWTMGGLSRATWPDVRLLAPIVAGGTLLLWAWARRLDALSLGEESARFLGLEPRALRRILLGGAVLLTASTVSLTGTIGFVGLIVPHMMRLVLGPGHRKLLPSSALAGGVFLVWADVFARLVLAPAELPVGVVTALVGVPFFLFLLRRAR